MRYAVVVAPPHFVLPADGSVFAAPEPVGPVCAALTRGGRRLLLVTSTPGLEEGFARALVEVGPGDDLVVYIAGSTTTRTDSVGLRVAAAGGEEEDGRGATADDPPASRPLPTEHAIALRDIAAAVKERQPSAVLYLVEAYHDGDGDDPMFAAEHVDAILRTLEARAQGHGVAVAVLPESEAQTPAWPFTRYLLAMLADPASRDEGGSATASLLHERLRAGGAAATGVQSFAFVRSAADFVVVEPGPAAQHVLASPFATARADEQRGDIPLGAAIAWNAHTGDEPSAAQQAHTGEPVPAARESHIEVPISVGELPSGRDSHVEVPISVGEVPRSRDSHVDPPISVAELTPAYGTVTDRPWLAVGSAPSTPDAPSDPSSGMVDTPRVPSEVSANAFAAAPSSAASFAQPSPRERTGKEPTPNAGVDDEWGPTADAPDTSRVSLPSAASLGGSLPEPRPTEPSLPEVRLPSEPLQAAADPSDVPSARGSEPSLPELEPLLELADEAFSRKALPQALAGYKAALMVSPPGDASGRADLYARIGEVKRAQGRTREAERCFEKAVRFNPAHRRALGALIQLAEESKDARRVIDLRRKLLDTLTVPDERVDELRAIADVLADGLADPRAAAETLDLALSIEGKSRAALQALRAGYEKLRRWPRVAEVLCILAETAEGPKEKAALRLAAGEVAIEHMREQDRGVALVEQALREDPTLDKALRVLVTGRTARAEWEAIEGLYLGLAERLTGMGDSERAWDTWRKLGVLRRDKLHNAEGAIEAFSNAVRSRPENVDARALLAEMHIASGDETRAIAQFERIALQAPTRSSTFTRLFGLHRRAARTDRAWLVASALAELGAADMDQQLFVDQYRPDGPIRPARSLDDGAWDELMRAPGADDVVGDVLRAIQGAAVAMRVEEMRQTRQLVSLDPARRQNASSTVSIVRSFHWAAQVLGLEPPDLYVMDDVPGGVAAVQAPAPTTALGPDVLRGLTTKDLAFVAGRHLTYFRPDHYCLVFYPTLSDISALFLGAVTIVLPNVTPPPNLRDSVARIRKVLAKQLSDDEKRRLQAAVGRLEARDGRVDLTAWIRSVELTAQRAGLLLCGDLAVATARLRAEAETRTIAELTYEDKRGDLLAFMASDNLARARALLGVEARSNVGAAPTGQLQAG